MATLFAVGCGGSSKIKSGDQAWKQKAYSVAVTMYKDEFKTEELPLRKAEIAFRIAESYRYMNKTQEAEQWYETAIDLNYDAIAFYNYGLMLKANERYQAAVDAFSQYAREEPFEKDKAYAQIKAIGQAKKWMKEKSNLQLRNMEAINTPANEYGPVLYRNGDLVFTSDRIDATGEDTYGWTGEKYVDIFLTKKQGDDYQGVASFSGQLNSGFNDALPTFNEDYTLMYFTRCGSQGEEDDYCYLYESRMTPSGEWSEGERLSFFGDTVNVNQPFYWEAEDALLFSADSTENGYGSKDLYISYRQGFGAWGEPVNLGSDINTEGNERFPYIDKEGTLFFASDGHPGMGGMDLFEAAKDGKKWVAPNNMKPPINSTADDFGITFDKIKPKGENDAVRESGFISSNRDGGKGGDDIYRFVLSNENIFVLKGIVLEKIFEDPKDPNSKVVDFEVVDDAFVELKKIGGGSTKVINNDSTDQYGRFSFDLEKNTNYEAFATKEGYFGAGVKATTKGKRDLENILIEVKVEILLTKIYEDVEIVIPNIYYDFDSTTLRPESFVALDTLLTIMQQNPKYQVEIGSHTDSRGSESYNMKLSQGRAQSVVDYLVQEGINEERLVPKGYGETKILNGCVDGVECTEEEHQENRRTTFKVIGDDFELESTRPDDIKVDPKEE